MKVVSGEYFELDVRGIILPDSPNRLIVARKQSERLHADKLKCIMVFRILITCSTFIDIKIEQPNLQPKWYVHVPIRNKSIG